MITWFIGQRIIAYWDIRKKRQEFDIATAVQFQQLYGEFKEIGKLWRIIKKNKDPNLALPEHTRWELLERATAAESKVEAILVKLATERHLCASDLKQLGLFRQAYQQLREAIRDDKRLNFGFHSPEYKLYNELASNVALLISSGEHTKNLSSKAAQKNLQEIVRIRSKDFKEELDKVEGGHRVESFRIAGPYTLRVRFDDETEQTIDFQPVLEGDLYGPLRDRGLFDQVRIDSEVHTLVWPNGADFDPATLHDWPELLPAMKARIQRWRTVST